MKNTLGFLSWIHWKLSASLHASNTNRETACRSSVGTFRKVILLLFKHWQYNIPLSSSAWIFEDTITGRLTDQSKVVHYIQVVMKLNIYHATTCNGLLLLTWFSITVWQLWFVWSQKILIKSVICCGHTTFHDTELWCVNVQLIHVTAQHFNEASLYM